MSVIETILSRAMNDPDYANLLFADPDQALAEYDLTDEEIAKLKSISRTRFEALEPEERKSLSRDFYKWHEDFVIIGNNTEE